MSNIVIVGFTSKEEKNCADALGLALELIPLGSEKAFAELEAMSKDFAEMNKLKSGEVDIVSEICKIILIEAFGEDSDIKNDSESKKNPNNHEKTNLCDKCIFSHSHKEKGIMPEKTAQTETGKERSGPVPNETSSDVKACEQNKTPNVHSETPLEQTSGEATEKIDSGNASPSHSSLDNKLVSFKEKQQRAITGLQARNRVKVKFFNQELDEEFYALQKQQELDLIEFEKDLAKERFILLAHEFGSEECLRLLGEAFSK